VGPGYGRDPRGSGSRSQAAASALLADATRPIPLYSARIPPVRTLQALHPQKSRIRCVFVKG